MPYGLIILFASITLVAQFICLMEASRIAKVVVAGIFIFCMASRFGWIHCNPIASQFLLVAVSLFIIFYRTWHQAKTGK
jgi:hypothetical protein